MSVYIQIGTNNGNDDFLKRVKRDNPDTVILVEPNKDLRKAIFENYASVTSFVVVKHVAITDNPGVVKLHYPKLQANGLAKNGSGYASSSFSLLPMDDWGDEFETIEVTGVTFSDLCDMYGITNIDFLAIDTEGYDAQIIKSIDFKKYNIKELEYEYWGFPEDCFTRYGEMKKHYGINGMLEVTDLLTGLGYKIEVSKKDTMNRIAIKQ